MREHVCFIIISQIVGAKMTFCESNSLYRNRSKSVDLITPYDGI
jgi:hypothetical protein